MALVTTGLSLLLLTVVDGAVGAPGDSRQRVAAIAAIVTEFVHTCSPEQCATLRRISRDANTTAPLRTLAAILLRVDHRPRFNDRQRLRALQGGSHPPTVRLLARAVEHLVHVPAAADRAELVALLTQRQGGVPSCSSATHVVPPHP